VATSDDPMGAVCEYTGAFNRGDAEAMAAACADPMQNLDGMSPHVWQGPTAAQDWWRDVLAEGEHLGASGYRIELGEPHHVDVSGDDHVRTSRPAGHPERLGMYGGTSQSRHRLATDAWAWAKGVNR